MKKMQILVLVSALLLSVYTANLRNTATSGLQQYLDNNSQSQIVQDLISTVQLHLKSGGKVKEVIEYIQEARNTSESDKVELVGEFSSEMERFDTEVAQQNTDLRNMGQELSDTIIEISETQKEIAFLEVTKQQLETELLNLDQREQNVIKARDNDIESFKVRQQRDSKAIAALTEIIPQLRDLLEGGDNNKSVEEATELLQKKQLDKHVMSLLQTSLKFSQAKLSTVIQKLESILEAIQVAKENDEIGEQESETRYNQLMSEISTIRTQKKSQLSITKNSLSLKNSDLLTAQANQKRLETNIETTTKLRDQTLATQETSRASYQRRINELNVAIQALNDVLEILESNQSNLSKSSDDADSRLE